MSCCCFFLNPQLLFFVWTETWHMDNFPLMNLALLLMPLFIIIYSHEYCLSFKYSYFPLSKSESKLADSVKDRLVLCSHCYIKPYVWDTQSEWNVLKSWPSNKQGKRNFYQRAICSDIGASECLESALTN